MSLVPSLLQAIVQLDGDALVMHVGDKPYVVSPTGQVDLATRGLTLEAVVGIVNQLLPIESQRALDEFGAAQYELPAAAEFPGEHFTIVAARGGDDVWAEVRRRRIAEDDRVPIELFESASGPMPMPKPERIVSRATPETRQASTPDVAHVEDDDDLLIPDVAQLWPGMSATGREGDPDDLTLNLPSLADAPAPATSAWRAPAPLPAPPYLAPVAESRPVAVPPPPSIFAPAPVPVVPAMFDLPVAPAPPVAAAAPAAVRPAPISPSAPTWAPAHPAQHSLQPPQPAVVLPLSRSPIRPDTPPPLGEQVLSGLDRLLRLAAARGASTLYLSSDARPSVRVDGDVHMLDGAPSLGPNDVESLLLTLMPERNAEALRTGVASEWICDLPDVGRVRCMSFRDHRGPGGVFRMMPVRAVTAEQLGLSREIQALAIEPEGLVLVAGPRSSGKRTLMSAFVDLINRTRRDHVITIESEINITHERNGSFVSQREVRGGSDEMVAVARAALREDPDVRTPALMNLALDAAGSGHLVIGGFPAHSASSAVDRIIDLYPSEYRRQVQLSLAQNLRGVVAQVLLRKTGGGRVAAREVLLNTPAVAGVLAEGKTSQLPLAIEGGRRQGMVPLNDALVGFVQGGIVDVREAYRRSADRAGFLALLKRQGIDTSAIERSA